MLAHHERLDAQRVKVVAGSQQAYVVPQTAVMQNEGGRYVWVASPDGKAVQRPPTS